MLYCEDAFLSDWTGVWYNDTGDLKNSHNLEAESYVLFPGFRS